MSPSLGLKHDARSYMCIHCLGYNRGVIVGHAVATYTSPGQSLHLLWCASTSLENSTALSVVIEAPQMKQVQLTCQHTFRRCGTGSANQTWNRPCRRSSPRSDRTE